MAAMACYLLLNHHQNYKRKGFHKPIYHHGLYFGFDHSLPNLLYGLGYYLILRSRLPRVFE